MVSGYFLWWYGEGFIYSSRLCVAVLRHLSDWFSLRILVKTWFAPWKNDVLRARNIALSDQFKLWEQNFASRLIGFFMRTVIILVAVIVIISFTILAIFGVLLWLLLPPLFLTLPVFASYLAFSS